MTLGNFTKMHQDIGVGVARPLTAVSLEPRLKAILISLTAKTMRVAMDGAVKQPS